MSTKSPLSTQATLHRRIAGACLWTLVTASACDASGSDPGTTESVASVASRAPGLHEKALGGPAAQVGGVRLDEAMEAYERFEKACRNKDADAVWAALAPGGQTDVNGRMQTLYEQANREEQERLSKLEGEPDFFSPQEYLISQFDKPKSVCPKGKWKLTNKQIYDQLFLMVRHVGEACEGLWFARTDGKVGVFPAGWYEPCPDNPASRVIADVGKRGRKLREEQAKAKAKEDKGEPVTPAQVKQAYEAYTKACKANDVDAMWKLVPEKSRQGLAEFAAKYRDNERILREDGWTRDIEAYDARAHFEFQLETTGFCPKGTDWSVLAASESPAFPGWLVVKATGSGRERCDVVHVTRDDGSLRVRSREGWVSSCPPMAQISEFVSK